MTGLQILREEAAGRVTLRLEGTLDGRTAQELSLSLQSLAKSEVVLDFAHLREFKDSAVGVLTHGLKEGAVEMRGLATHHERMFRYFGVLSSPATNRAWYTPEDVLSV
ncbi:STAS domain-containing protein [Corallococcus praedator]|uniref:STAS domain-containing protein n=1 Tax=Corallococcus praedator TaxID=2316724 RepID=A0ABX9QLG4_9BACT|nr:MULTISPECIES: STAS domain-containing protein [Corallococcus]RKH17778.1 STAS domain-containing protein [Corallococcus sp. CA047B]RKH31854.1 STAS domain-containing protein [Corallococcus sp. CA031C]RKI11625.1 STAS domain-containing protein [Corallococcus praedator]